MSFLVTVIAFEQHYLVAVVLVIQFQSVLYRKLFLYLQLVLCFARHNKVRFFAILIVKNMQVGMAQANEL